MKHAATPTLDILFIMSRKRTSILCSLRLLLTTLISTVVTHFRAAIRNPESLVNTADEEDNHDQKIDSEVKDIEAGLAVIPGWVSDRTRCHPRGTGTERCTKTEQTADKYNDEDFADPTTGANLLNSLSVRRQNNKQDKWKWQERYDGEVSLTVEQDIAIDAKGVGVESIRTLNNASDDHNDRHTHENIESFERPRYRSRPPQDWVDSSEHTLSV